MDAQYKKDEEAKRQRSSSMVSTRQLHFATGAAAVLCLCIAVVQIKDLGRSELEQQVKDGYVHLGDHNGFGTNSVFVNKGDGQGTSVKDQARFQSLAQQYKDYGHAARGWMMKHGLMSKAENAWATHMATGWEKAPVTMLAEEKAPRTVWQQLGVQDPATAAYNAMKQSDDAGYKARVMSLKEDDHKEEKKEDGDKPHANSGRLLPDYGAMGTNTAFLGMADTVDGRAQKAPLQSLAACGRGGLCPEVPAFLKQHGLISKAEQAWDHSMGVENAMKAPTSMLAMPARFRPGYKVPQHLPEAGGMGTNKAFLNKGDGKGQSTKAQKAQALHLLKSNAAKQVGKDVSGYLFKPAHNVGF